MIYLTGDTNGDFSRIQDFCSAMGTTKDDTMIVLGGVYSTFGADTIFFCCGLRFW